MINDNIITRDMYDKYFLPFYSPASFIPIRGLGSRIWDQKGKEYIDFSGGIAVASMGHCHPELIKVIRNQSRLLWHTSNFFTNKPQLKLASKLIKLSFASYVFFANSGAEANEAAFKLARLYCIRKFGLNKTKIISFNNSFHGRTLFTVSVGGNQNYSDQFGPLPGNIIHVSFNDLDAVTKVMDESVCAVVLELIQGEGGIIPADILFVQGIRSLCNKYNALFIVDEIQTGIGRTGTFFAYEQYNVVPDMLTIAKSLGGGFPISALLTHKKFFSVIQQGIHGTTYGGNPLACSVAERVLDFINRPKVLKGVTKRSHFFMKKIHKINNQMKLFKDIRIRGLLIGLELIPEISVSMSKILEICSDQGVLVLTAGKRVLRLAPSLIISYNDIIEGMNRFWQALKKL